LEHATGKGGDEFEVLSAHDVCFLNCWLFVLGCLRSRDLRHFACHQRDLQRDKALEVPSYFLTTKKAPQKEALLEGLCFVETLVGYLVS
jgi:hypothetical protein